MQKNHVRLVLIELSPGFVSNLELGQDAAVVEQERFVVLVKTVSRDGVAIGGFWATVKGLEELLGALLQLIDTGESHGWIAGGVSRCSVGSLRGVD